MRFHPATNKSECLLQKLIRLLIGRRIQIDPEASRWRMTTPFNLYFAGLRARRCAGKRRVACGRRSISISLEGKIASLSRHHEILGALMEPNEALFEQHNALCNIKIILWEPIVTWLQTSLTPSNVQHL